MTISSKIKYYGTATFWLLTGVAFVFFLGAAKDVERNRYCTGVKVNFSSDEHKRFIEQGDVVDLILEKTPGKILEVPVSRIDVQKLETHLTQSPYIQKAEIYVDIRGEMQVDVIERTPVLRLVSSKNNSYYISDEGIKMPVTDKFGARVLIASGHIADNGLTTGKIESRICHELYQLSRYLKGDEFWDALFEQIYVARNQDIYLIPKIGDHEIVLGSIENLEKKLNKLKAFYKEGLKHTGWSAYKQINLNYENQVVCTKK